MKTDRFRFRKHATIGAAAAEEDHEYLTECFVDTGDLSTLRDCTNPRRIVIGRTGTGKTALLNALAEHENAIVIRPESLSFNYLARSTVLHFFLEAGVKLDLFFRLLWRHVFTVELLKKKYHITNDYTKKSFLERMKGVFTRDKNKERAVEYLLKWGEKFWEETEYRIKEITSKIEEELKSSIGAKIVDLGLSASNVSKLTDQQRTEVVERGQSVINSIQMKELSDILEFLDEDVFADEKQNFYLYIDKLDEQWTEEKFRYLLIRSLIETLRDFIRVRNVKPIIALRNDLIERVFRLTRDAGFQEEKYRSLYLSLRWNEKQLKQLLDIRVNYLVRQSYTKKRVHCKDLLPSKISGEPTVEYMLQRTLLRPRELIEFFNTCIEQAQGCPTITKTMLFAAEGTYSKNRLRSLQDEWFADYPSLIDFTSVLRKQPSHFEIGEIDRRKVEEFCLNYHISNYDKKDELSSCAKNLAEGIIDAEAFLNFFFHVFYRTGVVGLKTETFESFQWSTYGPSTISAQTIGPSTRVSVHPMFWRVLGIKP